MKSNVNLKLLEQSIKLVSKASELENNTANGKLRGLLHEVNKVALGIPNITQQAEPCANDRHGIEKDSLLETIRTIREKIEMYPERSEAIFEFAQLLDQENEMVLNYRGEERPVMRPVKRTRLDLRKRERVSSSLKVNAGWQTSLF